MSETIIKLENISKKYRLGQVGTQTIRGDFQRWWHRMRGKEDPTLKIGQTNQLNQKSTIDNHQSDYVWALKDINLEVKQGEVLGIIGKNGAGKSTLLKLLSRVTGLNTGNIKVKSRIASPLEVDIWPLKRVSSSKESKSYPLITGCKNMHSNSDFFIRCLTEIRSENSIPKVIFK